MVGLEFGRRTPNLTTENPRDSVFGLVCVILSIRMPHNTPANAMPTNQSYILLKADFTSILYLGCCSPEQYNSEQD